jgi:hypothetical protein
MASPNRLDFQTAARRRHDQLTSRKPSLDERWGRFDRAGALPEKAHARVGRKSVAATEHLRLPLRQHRDLANAPRLLGQPSEDEGIDGVDVGGAARERAAIAQERGGVGHSLFFARSLCFRKREKPLQVSTPRCSSSPQGVKVWIS